MTISGREKSSARINECLALKAHPPLPARCLRQTIRLSLEEANKLDGPHDSSIQNTPSAALEENSYTAKMCSPSVGSTVGKWIEQVQEAAAA